MNMLSETKGSTISFANCVVIDFSKSLALAVSSRLMYSRYFGSLTASRYAIVMKTRVASPRRRDFEKKKRVAPRVTFGEVDSDSARLWMIADLPTPAEPTNQVTLSSGPEPRSHLCSFPEYPVRCLDDSLGEDVGQRSYILRLGSFAKPALRGLVGWLLG